MSDSPDSYMREWLLRLFPWFLLAGHHTYTVEKDNGDGTWSLKPSPGLLAPPRLPRVRQWQLGRVTTMVGSEVVIVYRDHDRTRPAIVGFIPLDGSTPDAVEIDAVTGVTIGASALLVTIGSGRVALPIGSELGHPVLYGDLVTVPTPTGPAVGAITQAPLTAPNQIAKVLVPA